MTVGSHVYVSCLPRPSSRTRLRHARYHAPEVSSTQSPSFPGNMHTTRPALASSIHGCTLQTPPFTKGRARGIRPKGARGIQPKPSIRICHSNSNAKQSTVLSTSYFTNKYLFNKLSASKKVPPGHVAFFLFMGIH